MSLIFPQSILNQHLVILGKTGAGKSSALRHIVEHLLKHNKRVCVVDPKGDWSGLKTSANGKGPGFPVIGFGDFKEAKATDVPLNAQSGKHVAELVATGNRPCIIGFRGWPTSQMTRFWIDFASTIFATNSGELYLVGDEFHNFAPKGKIMDPEAGKCLHWSNRLMNEGRGLGLVCLIASQRPQKVHNDTLTACETLVAMRVIHKADRDAVKDWIDGCGDIEQGREVLDSLAGMARGEAFVWSPEIGFGPKRMTFPMFETFDSFAPPQLQKRVLDSGWANVDLEAVKSKLASVIEEQKANDPAELKKTIAELRRELKAQKPAAVEKEIIRQPVFDAASRQLLEGVQKVCTEALEAARERADQLFQIHRSLIQTGERLSKTTPAPTPRALPVSRANSMPAFTPRSHPPANGEFSLAKCERSILTALAQYPQGRAANQLAVLTGYSSGSGGFNNSLSKLRSAEYITRGQPIQITDSGIAALGDWTPLPTGRELADHWLRQLPKCEREVLSKVLEVYPDGLSSEQVAQLAGYTPSSGGFNNALSRLRTLELITRGQPIRASEEFFTA